MSRCLDKFSKLIKSTQSKRNIVISISEMMHFNRMTKVELFNRIVFQTLQLLLIEINQINERNEESDISIREIIDIFPEIHN